MRRAVAGSPCARPPSVSNASWRSRSCRSSCPASGGFCTTTAGGWGVCTYTVPACSLTHPQWTVLAGTFCREQQGAGGLVRHTLRLVAGTVGMAGTFSGHSPALAAFLSVLAVGLAPVILQLLRSPDVDTTAHAADAVQTHPNGTRAWTRPQAR